MILRLYKESDNEACKSMLLEEGLLENKHLYSTDGFQTYTLENKSKIVGFFTLTLRHDLPFLQHFCVSRKSRSNKVARILTRFFVKTVKEMGFESAILHSCSSTVSKFIKYYFKVDPYGYKEEMNCQYYLVTL
jgi:hypothetical protein